MNLVAKRRMFMPGPTPYLPEAVVQALIQPIHHRKDDFKALLGDVQAGLREVFKTGNDVLVLACSGSGAMEASMINTVAPGEKALIGVAGKFGERWLELAEAYGIERIALQVPYGESVEPGWNSMGSSGEAHDSNCRARASVPGGAGHAPLRPGV